MTAPDWLATANLPVAQQIVDVRARAERGHVDLPALERLPKLAGHPVALHPLNVPAQERRSPKRLIVAGAQGCADDADGDGFRRSVEEALHGVLADEQPLAGCSQPSDVLECRRVIPGLRSDQRILVGLRRGPDGHVQPIGRGLVDPFTEGYYATGTGLVEHEQGGLPRQVAHQMPPEDPAVEIRPLAQTTNPTVMVTVEVMASCAATGRISQAAAQPARMTEQTPKQVERYLIVPSQRDPIPGMRLNADIPGRGLR